MKDDKTGDGLPPLQAGLNNAELLSAWIKKLPGVEPTERQLTAFALGAEVGFTHAQDLERQDWSRMHHALKDAGIHPGRTDDHLADVLRAAIAAAAARERELCAQVCDARDMGDGSREDQEARRCAAAIRGMMADAPIIAASVKADKAELPPPPKRR